MEVMAMNPNCWLVVLGVVYPVLLLARLILYFPPPWWMLANEATVFFVLVLPALSLITLVVMKLRGFQIAWVSIPAFSLWLGLVAWFYLNLLAEAAASV
jgi:hypothetical protein